MNNILPHITLETAPTPQHSIIWLHGLGANGEDFVSIAEQINLPLAVRYIFPHAPMRPVTINGGAVMPAWYDIVASNIGTMQDKAGMQASHVAIENLIAQEKQRGIPAKNIFLAGYSQGGAVALHTGLRHAEKLAGILALSTYLPLAERLADEATAPARLTPIFMAHGTSDTVVSFSFGKMSATKLREHGCDVEWHEYDMPHSLCAEEVSDIEAWLSRQLNLAT